MTKQQKYLLIAAGVAVVAYFVVSAQRKEKEQNKTITEKAGDEAVDMLLWGPVLYPTKKAGEFLGLW